MQAEERREAVVKKGAAARVHVRIVDGEHELKVEVIADAVRHRQGVALLAEPERVDVEAQEGREVHEGTNRVAGAVPLALRGPVDVIVAGRDDRASGAKGVGSLGDQRADGLLVPCTEARRRRGREHGRRHEFSEHEALGR